MVHLLRPAIYIVLISKNASVFLSLDASWSGSISPLSCGPDGRTLSQGSAVNPPSTTAHVRGSEIGVNFNQTLAIPRLFFL
jgi:hypothetical protein